MIVIGSTALQQHGIDVTPNDLDLVGTYDEAVAFRKKFGATTFYPISNGRSIFMRNAEGKICEIEIAWEGSRAEKFINFLANNGYWSDVVSIENYPCFVPCLDVLYLLKMSHRYLKDSPHFLKTMRDIQMLRSLGASIDPEHQEFYEERMRDTYTYNLPKLDVSKGEFFDTAMTGVEQKYDHDTIHLAVKHFEKPAYEYFKPEDEQVMCSKDMFFACEEHIRLAAVVEESYVLALERSLVPYPNGKMPKEAFDLALMKVCTSITSGWFREYAWENYDKAQEMYSDDYVKWFEAGVKYGVVKLKENE